jgi:N-acetylglucosamine kinase-like BadF-type ATPase
VSRLFLGVDGGQSSTVALIGDDAGRVVGVGRAGPCNHVRGPESRRRFAEAVDGSVKAALEETGVKSATFEAACLGFSGGSEDKETLARELISAKTYAFTHDALIALLGATKGEPGVIAIAGTGSIAFGRNGAGRTARAGGWGYLFGDEGGAFDIVRQAVRAVVRHEEGWGPGTSLLLALTEAAGARDANDLLHRFYTDDFSRARVASFARLVDDAARVGDAVARDILMGAAQALATLVAAVRGQLFERDERVLVSYAGGAFGSAMILERFRMLVELQEGNHVEAPAYGPAEGALMEAYRLAGVTCTLSRSDGAKDPLEER